LAFSKHFLNLFRKSLYGLPLALEDKTNPSVWFAGWDWKHCNSDPWIGIFLISSDPSLVFLVFRYSTFRFRPTSCHVNLLISIANQVELQYLF